MPNKPVLDGDVHDQLLHQFSTIYEQLNEISYIKHTVSKLHQIIDDSTNPIQILLIGNERAGKSTILNAILGRNIIPVEEQYHADVHIFIKYSKREYIEMKFLDGYTFELELNKLEILLNTTTELGEILREHIDFVTIYLNNDLLQKVTFIDGQAIAMNDQQILFFPHRILNRADEIFWVVSAEQSFSEQEQLFFKKISAIYKKPYLIINKFDLAPTSKTKIVNNFEKQLSTYIENIIPISAKLHIDSKKTNEMQLFIDSNFTVFKQLLLALSTQEQQKKSHTYKQLAQWIELLQGELMAIKEREPYVTSLQQIRQFEQFEQFAHSKKERNEAIIKTFEEDYKNAAQVFDGVQTLYQLLQTIGNHVYFRNEVIDLFEELATSYLHSLRSYRTLHSEYELQVQQLQKEIKFTKIEDQMQFVKISSKSNVEAVTEQLHLLNEKQQFLAQLRQTISQFEEQIVSELSIIQEQLNMLVNTRLDQIYKQVDEVNKQQQAEHASLEYAYEKIKDFAILIHVQQMLLHDIKPRILSIPSIFDDEKESLSVAIDELNSISFPQTVQSEIVDASLFAPISVEFKQNYPTKALMLNKENIISSIPEVPKQLIVQ